MPKWLDAARTRVVVMDGAMGTRLQAMGLDLTHETAASWSVTNPDEVRAVHRSYVDAGAEILVTNTFLAADPQTRRAGVERARDEVAAGGWVLLDVGPMDRLPSSPVEARAAVADLPPIDGVLLETFSDVESLTVAEAFAGIGVPVILSLAYRRSDGKITSFDGQSPEFFAERGAGVGVSVIGVNCGRDMSPDAVVEVVRRYREVTDLPILARPNAGMPPRTDGEMAASVPELVRAGARMIGGCCGTTPEFVRAVANARLQASRL